MPDSEEMAAISVDVLVVPCVPQACAVGICEDMKGLPSTFVHETLQTAQETHSERCTVSVKTASKSPSTIHAECVDSNTKEEDMCRVQVGEAVPTVLLPGMLCRAFQAPFSSASRRGLASLPRSKLIFIPCVGLCLCLFRLELSVYASDRSSDWPCRGRRHSHGPITFI